jgi:hypothetical protein
MRLIGWNVQPIVMADGGEFLTPVETSVVHIPAGRWPWFKGGADERALEGVRRQVEGTAPAGEGPDGG